MEEKQKRFPWRGRGKEEALQRQNYRDEWARKMGYPSWWSFYGKARRGERMQNYVSLLTSLYRAGVPEAEKIADIVLPYKGMPKKKLVGDAKKMAKMPMLYPGKKRKAFDASLPRHRKRLGK